MKVAVVVFPGTNCELDTAHALATLGADPHFVWHREASLTGFDGVVLPGGFAHGDYLRTGAIARFSPVHDGSRDNGAVRRSGSRGVQRLPDPVRERFASGCARCQPRPPLHLQARPRAHRARRFPRSPAPASPARCSASRSTRTRATGSPHRRSLPVSRPTARSSSDTRIPQASSPLRPTQTARRTRSRGSATKPGTSSVLMPHPERASDPALGSTDGLVLLRSFLAAVPALT